MTHRSSSGCSCPLPLRLSDGHFQAEISALFTYDAGDPFADRITFGGAGSGTEDPITWLVGRDLLRTGLDRPAGDGDVRVGPTAATDVLFLHLRAPSGEALMELSRAALASFVVATEILVPFGSEETVIDFDDELAFLLSDGDGDPADR
jgi:Streptomyces sporulation and cell division protein, SsgA